MFSVGKFALAEGKKGGQFYTPESVVRVDCIVMRPTQLFYQYLRQLRAYSSGS